MGKLPDTVRGNNFGKKYDTASSAGTTGALLFEPEFAGKIANSHGLP